METKQVEGVDCLVVPDTDCSSPLLPLYCLPKPVVAFALRDLDKEPIKTDHEYFDAVLACESARLLADNLGQTLQTDTYSTRLDNFASPACSFFRNGHDLSNVLHGLTCQLDQKRQSIIQAMKSKPLIECFLDEMEASDLQCKVFRHVLALASNRAIVRAASADMVQELFSDDGLTMPTVMSWCSVNSMWVKQQVYERLVVPSESISALDAKTMRVLMGLYDDMTTSQFHELQSTILQDTLRGNEAFQQTTTGEKVLQQHELTLSTADDEEEFDTEAVPFDDLFNSSSMNVNLTDALAGAGDHEGRIFNVLGDLPGALDKVAEDPDKTDTTTSGEETEIKEVEFGPYGSELEYLEDQMRIMVTTVKINKAKDVVEDDGDEDKPLHAALGGYSRRYDGTDSKEVLKLEKEREVVQFEKKLKNLQDKVKLRLRATKKECNKTPRLEQLCESLHLDQFERFVLLDLLRTVVLPYDYSDDDGRPSGSVATYIERFSQSIEEKMRCRKYFYKSGTLVKEALITVYGGSGFLDDLNHAQVVLDRRIFDWLIALDTEFSELVEGSHLYTPDVDLDDVILPKQTKDSICEAVLNFDSVKDTYRSLEIDKKITYGRGTVILFYGASGTGKTMMANAIGNKLKKKMLLVNFPSLGDANSSGEVIKLLFREARIKKSILFFDECESLFASRDLGNYSINTLLSELERFDDLCIMATNRQQDLDEAMYRRVSLAVEFRRPDHMLREKIWKTLRPPNLELEDDVNYKELARKYELTGGLIKNAWLSSVTHMVNRGVKKVNVADLEQAASAQIISRLNNESFDRRVVATCGIESVIASPRVTESLKNIVQHTKAQSVLFGQWGFGKIHRAPSGVSALFTGPPGTGKTMAAEAIGFDLGSPLLVVNSAELVNKYVGETGKNIEAVFYEAKSKDAVLVFDEGEGLFGTRQEGGDSVSRHDTINVGLLLQHMENFTGVCIVVTNQKEAIDEAFFRRFHYCLKFEPPNMRQREKLWKSIVPDDCPLADDVSFSSLANKYELCGGGIKSAVLRGATKAALRVDEKDCLVTMQDLEDACEEEISKRSSNAIACRALYS